MLERVELAMTPGEAVLFPRTEAYVVIDALRATTTMAVAFHRGLRRLRVVESIEAARAAREPGVILLGEQGGRRPEGFDYGNSPAEVAAAELANREGVQVTSNGTVALTAVAPLGAVFAAALVNLGAVSRYIARFQGVTLVCAGNGGARIFSLEDFAVAAAFVRELRAAAPGASLGDGALLALELEQPERLIHDSAHAVVTRGLGFEADIALAMRRDAAPSVPAVTSFGDGWAVMEDAVR